VSIGIIRKVKIPQSILKKMEEVAKQKRGTEELAGVMLGYKIHDTVYVRKFKIGENILHDPFRFFLDPEQLYKFIIEGEEKGLELVALWHTHPSSPNPSLIDLKYMELWPIVWIITSSLTGEFTASIYRDGKLHSVIVEIDDFQD